MESYSKKIFSPKRRNLFTKNPHIKKDLKLKIKNIVFQFTLNEQDKRRRKIFNNILKIVCIQGDIYTNDFYQYSIQVLNKIKNDKSFDFLSYQQLKSVVAGFCEISKKKSLIGGNSYTSFMEIFLPLVISLWKNLTEEFYGFERIDNLEIKELLFQFNYLIDKLVIYIHSASKNLYKLSDLIQNNIKELVQKNEKIFLITQKMENIQNDKNITEKMVKIIIKTSLIYSYDFRMIFDKNPIIFVNILENYLTFMINYYAYSWKSEILKKSLSLLLLKILKTFIFYTSSENLQNKGLDKRLKIDLNFQNKCYQSFQNLFNNNSTLENLLQEIVSEKMIYNFDDIDFETFIEDQENTGIDMVHSELDCSLPKINSLIARELFYKFPEKSLNIFYTLLNSIMKKIINLNDEIIDNVFNLLIYLPNLYEDLKITNHPLNFNEILEFLFTKGKDNIIFTRRFLIVFKNFKMYNDDNNRQNYCKMILEFFEINDDIVQFETLECLGSLIKNDSSSVLDYSLLLNITTPLFIKFLQKFKNPSLVFKLGNYLSTVLEKSQNNLNENNILAFKDLNINLLISKNSKLMSPIIMDILKSLVFAFSEKQSDFILDLCLDFIKLSNDNFDEDNLNNFLSFWLVCLKNTYDLPKNKNRLSLLINLFYNNLQKFSSYFEEEIISNILAISEEILLVGEKSKLDLFLQFTEETYKKANEFPEESSKNIKSHIFGTYSTYLLITLNENNFQLKNFEFCLNAVLTEIVESKQNNNKNNLRNQSTLITQTISLFNRFLLNNPKDIISYISNRKIKRYKYWRIFEILFV